MRKKDDLFLKGAIEASFFSMLQFMIPAAEKELDTARKPVFFDRELAEMFPEKEKKETVHSFADLLARVYLLNGEERLVLVHIEMQVKRSRNFAQKMFRYHSRLSGRYQQPVTLIALFTGKRHRKFLPVPVVYQEVFSATQTLFSYRMYHILNHSAVQLLKMDNLFALVVLAAQKALLRGKVSDEELNEQRLVIARMLLRKFGYGQEKTMLLLIFLKEYLFVTDAAVNQQFDREIDSLTGKTNTMDILKIMTDKAEKKGMGKGIRKGMNLGLQKGREESKTAFVKNLLKQTDFTAAKIAAIALVTVAFVEKLKKGTPENKTPV